MKQFRCSIQTSVAALTCDRCNKEVAADDPAAADFLSLDFVGGCASALGDGAKVELELCSACLKEVLGPWLRVSDGPLLQSLQAFDPDRHGGELPVNEPSPSPLKDIT